MAIFAIGILAVASLQISATRGNASARKVGEALEFAQDQIEATMATPFSSLSAGTIPTNTNGYTITRVIAAARDTDGNSIAGIYEVRVSVTDPSGVERAALRFLKPANM